MAVRDALQEQESKLKDLRLSYLLNFAVEVAQSRPEADLRVRKGGLIYIVHCPSFCASYSPPCSALCLGADQL